MRVFIFLFMIPGLAIAQAKVESKAYNWAERSTVQDENRTRRQYLDGATDLLGNLEIHTSTVQGGEAPHPPHTHEDQEELVIIKEGTLTATVGKNSRVLGPGSVVYVLPGEEHGFVNAGNVPCTYFIIKLNYPAYNGPMINYLHRLIINPTLLLLLIPAFYYQKTVAKKVPDSAD